MGLTRPHRQYNLVYYRSTTEQNLKSTISDHELAFGFSRSRPRIRDRIDRVPGYTMQSQALIVWEGRNQSRRTRTNTNESSILLNVTRPL